jgi:cytochrome c biogenesis protein CcdA
MTGNTTVAFAFSAGVLAAFNPCAFAMWPSFLTSFLGVEDEGFAEFSLVRRALTDLMDWMIQFFAQDIRL